MTTLDCGHEVSLFVLNADLLDCNSGNPGLVHSAASRVDDVEDDEDRPASGPSRILVGDHGSSSPSNLFNLDFAQPSLYDLRPLCIKLCQRHLTEVGFDAVSSKEEGEELVCLEWLLLYGLVQFNEEDEG